MLGPAHGERVSVDTLVQWSNSMVCYRCSSAMVGRGLVWVSLRVVELLPVCLAAAGVQTKRIESSTQEETSCKLGGFLCAEGVYGCARAVCFSVTQQTV